MKCPYCHTSFFEAPARTILGIDIEGPWNSIALLCPSCKKLIVQLEKETNLGTPPRFTEKDVVVHGGEHITMNNPATITVKPCFASTRPACPKDVPIEFAKDYTEACSVLPLSSNAAAALSRRCLQHILREKAGVNHGNLKNEIDQAKGNLPAYVTKVIDAPRRFGNLSAHPNIDDAGILIDVDPEEADWILDIIELVFDHYFVKPAEADRMLTKLDNKYP